jgi:hypothetical protein
MGVPMKGAAFAVEGCGLQVMHERSPRVANLLLSSVTRSEETVKHLQILWRFPHENPDSLLSRCAPSSVLGLFQAEEK